MTSSWSFIFRGETPARERQIRHNVSGLRITSSADVIIESQPALLGFRFLISDCTSFSITGSMNILSNSHFQRLISSWLLSFFLGCLYPYPFLLNQAFRLSVTGYFGFYNSSPPGMFLPLKFILVYWIAHVIPSDSLMSFSLFPTRKFYRGVPSFSTMCPCGVWCRGLTICPTRPTHSIMEFILIHVIFQCGFILFSLNVFCSYVWLICKALRMAK